MYVPKKSNLSIFAGSRRGMETHKNSWIEMEKYMMSFRFLRKNRCHKKKRGVLPFNFALRSYLSIFLRIWSRVLTQNTEPNLLYLDPENHMILWNHIILLKSIVNPISDRSSLQLNPILLILFLYVRVWEEGPNSSCLSFKIVALSFSTFWLRGITQR